MEDKRDLIQRIRRRYNQDVEHTDEDAAEAASANMLTIAGAANLLSNELYSKPTHFIYELVQNADDCRYDAGLPPSLLLLLFEDALLSASNEVGFSEADVRAICDISKSTKSRRVGAFTGEKGIGFKATAVVSEVTFIDSNEFKFCFDMTSDAYEVSHLGLVCPRWEDDLSSRMQQWVQDKLAGCDGGSGLTEAVLGMVQASNTRIFMQLKPDCDRQLLAGQLADLSPFMLLNLRKLRNMNVMIAASDGCHTRSFSCCSSDGSSGRLSITVCEGPWGGSLQRVVHHLICLRKTIRVPEGLTDQEEKRQGVNEVELVFALPVDEDGTTALPDNQAELFAFLPVRPYGFRFHIQADFILPSSREGIVERSAWNKWLRDELAPAFVSEALQALSGGIISCAALLQFLPLPGDVQDVFLRAASDRVMELLRTGECVLSASGQLREPATLMLPEPLLAMPDGEQLISNKWLQVGLPGLEYVSEDLIAAGSKSSGQRAAAVLRHLGCGSFTAGLLVKWLKAAGTQQLLQGLPLPQRSTWLQALYSCLQRLAGQAFGGLSMFKGNQWSSNLGGAPILQLHGEQQLTMVKKATTTGRLVLWNPDLGGDPELALFSRNIHSSKPLLFVEPSAQSAACEDVLRHFWGVRRVELPVLVEDLLQQQEALQLPHAQHEQLFRFLLRNRDQLGPAELKQLQLRLQLRNAGTGYCYSLARSLFMPLKSDGQVPEELQADLQLSGLAFLHAKAGAGADADADAGAGAEGAALNISGAATDFLKQLGVSMVSAAAAVEALLQLYDSEDARVSIRQEQHLRHIRFLAASPNTVQQLLPSIRSCVYLYSELQDAGSEGPDSLAEWLFWPLEGGARTISRHLLATGKECVHRCYQEAAGAKGLRQFLVQVAGVIDGPNQVTAALLELHVTPGDLRRAAEFLQLPLDELLLQQLQYIASVRPHLSDAVQASLRAQLQLLSSSGQLLLGHKLHLPPDDQDERAILADLCQSGSSLQLLAGCQPLLADEESRLMLTKLLGLQQADAGAIVRSIVELHASGSQSGSCSIPEGQLLKQLAFLSKHIQLLESEHQLLQHVQQAVRLQDAKGRYAAARDLHQPLARQFISLQEDMDASGMRFLHPQYTGARKSSTAARRQQKQLHELLLLMGVKVADAAAVVCHMLQLYEQPRRGGGNSVTTTMPAFSQHLAHVLFLREHWSGLDAALHDRVKRQLLLYLQPGGSSSFSTGSPGPVYVLPSPDSWETEMLPALQLGGANFISLQYSSSSSSEDDQQENAPMLQQWMQKLGLQLLTPAAAAGFLLAAHRSGLVAANHSTEQIVRHALYLAAHSPQLDRNALVAAKQDLLLALQPASSSITSAVAYTSASERDIYYPAAGAGWRLQQVLLPSECSYIHPAYARGMRQLAAETAGVCQTVQLQSFFIVHLGLLTRPTPKDLQAVVAAGDRWQPLLLLLADNWASYSAEHKQQLEQLLPHMQVATSGGTRALQDCFLPSQQYSSELLAMLRQLGLAFLDLHNPGSGASWSFLEHFGVSTGLTCSSLLKILRQLSAANTSPDLHSMQALYKQLQALATLQPDVVAGIRRAFEEAALVFVPPGRGPAGSGQKPGCWVTVNNPSVNPGVLWSGNRTIFPRKAFLKPKYKELESFFCELLGVRSAMLDDLKDALLELSEQPVTVDTPDIVLSIYKELAGSAAADELPWLPGLMRKRVLLAEVPGSQLQAAHNIQFVAAAAGSTLYLPDDPRLVKLFRGHVMLLAVPTDELPGLKPLLALIRPRLKSLSSSVRRSYTNNTVGSTGAAMQPDGRLTQLVQATLRLAARYVYHSDAPAYLQLYSSGRLGQLAELSACKAPGLLETLSLGSVSQPQEAGAAVAPAQPADGQQQQPHAPLMMLVNSALRPRDQLRHMSDELAVLLCETSNNQELKRNITNKIDSLMRDLECGNTEEAENQLQHENISQIPPGKQPWHPAAGSQAGAATQHSKQVWESDDENDGEAANDTGCSTTDVRHEAAQLAGALGRVQLGAADGLPPLVAAAAAAAVVQDVASPAAYATAGPRASLSSPSPSPSMAACSDGAAARPRKHLRAKRYASSREPLSSQHDAAVYAGDAGSQPDAGGSGPAVHSGTQYPPSRAGPMPKWYGTSGIHQPTNSGTQAQQSPVQFSSSVRTADDTGQFVFSVGSAATEAASETADDDCLAGPGFGQQVQRVLTAANAANGASLQQLLRAVSSGNSRPPTIDIAGWLRAPTATAATAANGSPSSTGVPPTAVLFERCTRLYQELTITESVTRAAAAFVPDTESAGAARAVPSPAAAAASATADGSGADTAGAAAPAAAPAWPGDDACGSGRQQQVTGVLGELFLFGWLSRQLPDFTADNFHSGARRFLGLPEPESEPSYDFLYHDAQGHLCGSPGTLCFIECKATSADLLSGRSDEPKAIELSAREWELAQQVHRLQLEAQQQVTAAGDSRTSSGGSQQDVQRCRYIIVRVDRVGSAAGPRVVALLQDPVQLLAEGRLRLSGELLLLHNYFLNIE